jgi:hypothetical protein
MSKKIPNTSATAWLKNLKSIHTLLAPYGCGVVMSSHASYAAPFSPSVMSRRSVSHGMSFVSLEFYQAARGVGGWRG